MSAAPDQLRARATSTGAALPRCSHRPYQSAEDCPHSEDDATVATVRINGAACILALSAAVLAGCASPTTGTGSRGWTPAHSPSAATRTSTSATPAGLGSALTRIALRKGDLATGYTLRLIPGGDTVRGEVTLDNCGFNFTTEAHRVARRQYAI